MLVTCVSSMPFLVYMSFLDVAIGDGELSVEVLCRTQQILFQFLLARQFQRISNGSIVKCLCMILCCGSCCCWDSNTRCEDIFFSESLLGFMLNQCAEFFSDNVCTYSKDIVVHLQPCQNFMLLCIRFGFNSLKYVH